VAESFFHTLKTALVHHEDYRSRIEAEASIFEYTLKCFTIVSGTIPILGRWHHWHSKKRLLAAS